VIVVARSADEVIVHFKALTRRAADTGARAAAVAMGDAFVEGVVSTELSRYSHPDGTPTPSPPGEPPARISGSLARSVRADRPVPVTRTRWQVETGPRIVYGRIQELGGDTGRGHATHLPARPYLRPAVVRMARELHDVAVNAFLDATR
jgi:hypothetical protein